MATWVALVATYIYKYMAALVPYLDFSRSAFLLNILVFIGDSDGAGKGTEGPQDSTHDPQPSQMLSTGVHSCPRGIQHEERPHQPKYT